MKKLLLPICFLLLAIAVEAQDTKPTKEQTIEYIKNYFNEKPISHDDRDSNDNIFYWKLSDFRLVFNSNASLEFSYTSSFSKIDKNLDFEVEDRVSNKKFLIPLNEIEELKLEIGGCTTRCCAAVYMAYKTSKIKDRIPIAANCLNNDAEKLVKAFNHLRKLCGAPEPISFD